MFIYNIKKNILFTFIYNIKNKLQNCKTVCTKTLETIIKFLLKDARKLNFQAYRDPIYVYATLTLSKTHLDMLVLTHTVACVVACLVWWLYHTTSFFLS